VAFSESETVETRMDSTVGVSKGSEPLHDYPIPHD
jgi:hypothetical protein